MLRTRSFDIVNTAFDYENKFPKLKGSVGADLHALEQDRAIRTDPDETRRRRTIRLIQNKHQSWGFTLQTYGIRNKRTQAVEIMSYVDYVEIDGAAWVAGMRRGDIILSVNGESVEPCSHRQLVSKIQNSGPELRLVVLFEDCCQKVELHERYLRLKRLLSQKVKELRNLEAEEKRISQGIPLSRLDLFRQSTYSSSSSDWDIYSEIVSPSVFDSVPVNRFAFRNNCNQSVSDFSIEGSPTFANSHSPNSSTSVAKCDQELDCSFSLGNNEEESDSSFPVVNSEEGLNSSFPIVNSEEDINNSFPIVNNEEDLNSSFPLVNNEEDINNSFPIVNSEEDLNSSFPLVNNEEDINNSFPIVNNEEDLNSSFPLVNNEEDINNSFPIVNNEEDINNSFPIVNSEEEPDSNFPIVNNEEKVDCSVPMCNNVKELPRRIASDNREMELESDESVSDTMEALDSIFAKTNFEDKEEIKSFIISLDANMFSQSELLEDNVVLSGREISSLDTRGSIRPVIFNMQSESEDSSDSEKLSRTEKFMCDCPDSFLAEDSRESTANTGLEVSGNNFYSTSQNHSFSTVLCASCQHRARESSRYADKDSIASPWIATIDDQQGFQMSQEMRENLSHVSAELTVPIQLAAATSTLTHHTEEVDVNNTKRLINGVLVNDNNYSTRL